MLEVEVGVEVGRRGAPSQIYPGSCVWPRLLNWSLTPFFCSHRKYHVPSKSRSSGDLLKKKKQQLFMSWYSLLLNVWSLYSCFLTSWLLVVVLSLIGHWFVLMDLGRNPPRSANYKSYYFAKIPKKYAEMAPIVGVSYFRSHTKGNLFTKLIIK